MEQEKAKKILVILAVLMLFGGTCYYYGFNKPVNVVVKAKGNNPTVLANISNVKEPVIKKEQVLKQIQPELKPEIKMQTDNGQVKVPKQLDKAEPEKIVVFSSPNKYKPTGKRDLLALAGKTSGKSDPFSYSESRSVLSSGDTKVNPLSMPTSLPPVPTGSKIVNLPSLPPGLPGFNPSQGLAPPPAPRLHDEVLIKGFIGNKVIAEIDGVVESLAESEKVGTVKVLNVDSSNFTAKFLVKDKVVVKTLKTLTAENPLSF
jgi:hypothetical protein